MLTDYRATMRLGNRPPKTKKLKKLGTLEIGVVETTPVVWQGALYRFEWVRNNNWGVYGKKRPCGCYHFVNMETGAETPDFAENHAFGCCYAEDGVMYAHGGDGPGGGHRLNTFWSEDLVHWEKQLCLEFPEDIKLYNTSVCKGPEGYVMAIEVGGSNPVVGQAFTCLFATSPDLKNWTLMDPETYVYSRDRYTACPAIRYCNGLYYIIYLEGAPLHRWIPYIVRTKDFVTYEPGVDNPVLMFGDEDKQLIHPEHFTPEEREIIRNAVDVNNSDVDLCEYNGKTVILYSWGDQLGEEFLAQAEYDGSMQEFLESFFAKESLL